MSNETKHSGPIEALAVLDRLTDYIDPNGHTYTFNEVERVRKARAAFAELIEAGNRTIRAFEALGNANSVLPVRLARMECESAMVAQKAALANIGGAK